MAIVSCFKPVEAPCAIFPSCVLKRALAKARDAFLAVLADYTLADLVAPRAALAGQLGIASRRGAPH
jgi:Rrf2 family nitric oxide-sensitive transcriptional repressor